LIEFVARFIGSRKGNLKSGKSNETKDDDDVLEAATRLEEFSLLRQRQRMNRTRSYDMHKLVQEATRYAIDQGNTNNEGLYFLKEAFEILLQLFPDSNHETWTRCETLLSHALAVTARPEVSRENMSISALLSKVSGYFHDQGLSRENEPISLKALKLRKEVLSEKHPNTISSTASLAATYHQHGRSKETEEISVEVLQLRKEVLGEKHPDTISSMASLAATYHQQGRAKEAEELALRARD